MNANEPNWEDAASEILTVLLPLLLKEGDDNRISMSDLEGFRTRIVEILHQEGEKAAAPATDPGPQATDKDNDAPGVGETA